jgi:hypothetical protein
MDIDKSEYGPEVISYHKINQLQWQKSNYTGPCVWYVYLNQKLTNTIRTDGTEEDVKRLMKKNDCPYDTIYRGPDFTSL